MFYLLFRANRVKPGPPWAFWDRRRTADVYAWIALDDADAARQRAHTDMEARGWRIERFKHVRPVDRDFPRDDWSVRLNVRLASKGTPIYNFYKPSEEDAEQPGPAVITSRYLDSTNIALDPSRIPENLRPLLRFAPVWAIGDDVERRRFIVAASPEEKREFVTAVAPHFEAIERYSRAHENTVPVPDEVIALDMVAEAAAEASHDVDM